MFGKLRNLATGGATSVLKKFLTFTVATGLAASMTLGATPVSATYTWEAGFQLDVDDTSPQWGDPVEFSAEINWTSCKRIPTVYLLGTSDNGDPISVRLTGEPVGSTKTYSYAISYGGVDDDGVPYDYDLTPAERAADNDIRLAAGWHSFQLKATSTRAGCSSLNRVQYSDAVEFYVGPHFDDVHFTTNAMYEFLFSDLYAGYDADGDDFTTGLVNLSHDEGDGFESGMYSYELTSEVGDEVSGDWIDPDGGEIVGDILSLDATAGIDWSDGENLAGINCYLDEEVELSGDPVADGHHIVDDSDALEDCANIDISELGEHTLTVEYWIDSCTSAGLDCLSWTTYTFNFARVENQDAVPYEFEVVDASTGYSLLDLYMPDWDDSDLSSDVTLGADDTNGLTILADLPFGAEMSCVYDSGDDADDREYSMVADAGLVELTLDDSILPSDGSGVSYLDCTVTPEDPSAESWEYRVVFDRVGSNLDFSDLRVFTDEVGELVVDDSPMATYDERVDFTAGVALWEDETAGLEITLEDETTNFSCYAAAEDFDMTSDEVDCSGFALDTPYDGTTGVWLELTAEDGSSIEYLIVIEHTIVSTDATLKDESSGLQFQDEYGVFEVAMCSDFTDFDYGDEYIDSYTPFNGDYETGWCVVAFDDSEGGGWYLYGTDSSTGTWLTDTTYFNEDTDYASVECDSLRYASDTSGDCDDRHLASRTDDPDDDDGVDNLVDGWNDFEITVLAEDNLLDGPGTSNTYEASVYRVDDSGLLENLRVFTDGGSLMQLRDEEGDPVSYDREVKEYWVYVREADIGTGANKGLDINETRLDAVMQSTECFSGTTPVVTTAVPDCDKVVVPEASTEGQFVVDIDVTAENGEVTTYTVHFIYRVFDDGLSELKVDGNDVVDHSSGIGGSFDGTNDEDWYWVTDNVDVDITAALGEAPVPGLDYYCYREEVHDSGCDNIALVESAWTTIQVKTKTGGEGGTLYQTYTIEIYRESTVKTLSTLTANNGSAMTLSPTFSPTTYAYAASSVSGLIDVDFDTTSTFADAVCTDDDDDSTTDCLDIDVSDGNVTVEITVTAENGDEQVYTLNLSAVPPMPAPEYLTRASVNGTAASGRTLTANVGTWRYQPTYAYQWFRCNSAVSLQRGGADPAGCSAIGGATSSTYRLVAADRTKFVLVKITGTNLGGSTYIYTNSTRAVR